MRASLPTRRMASTGPRAGAGLRALCAAAVMTLAATMSPASAQTSPTAPATNALVMLIEFERIEGVRHWERELDKRGLTALVQAQYDVLAKYPKDFGRLALKGYTLAGLYAEKAFWDMPYDEQLARMREVKAEVEKITLRPMRVFGSRYFAYDENTLRAADALGVEYVLARGTAGARAIIYAPQEYKAKIVSVSNVPFKEMGSGSLCDYSLWARGSTDLDFASAVERAIAGRPSDMILVSHAYLGGTKIKWWRAYEAALARPDVAWRRFDDWVGAVQVVDLPFARIPTNREVKYDIPRPAVPLDKLEDIPGVGSEPAPPSDSLLCQ